MTFEIDREDVLHNLLSEGSCLSKKEIQEIYQSIRAVEHTKNIKPAEIWTPDRFKSKEPRKILSSQKEDTEKKVAELYRQDML